MANRKRINGELFSMESRHTTKAKAKAKASKLRREAKAEGDKLKVRVIPKKAHKQYEVYTK